MMRLTPKHARSPNPTRASLYFSKKSRTLRLPALISVLLCRSNLIRPSLLGSAAVPILLYGESQYVIRLHAQLVLSYVSREQAVHGERATLPFIVRVQHNDDIFDCDDDCKAPDDN